VFNRLTMSGVGGRKGRRFMSGSSEQVGDGESEQRGRKVSFQGRSVTIISQNVGGARRVAVHFDESFGTCTASVIRGKETGSTKIVARSLMQPGRITEIHSVTTSDASCSVRTGNVFD
jgi:hypothetical protein